MSALLQAQSLHLRAGDKILCNDLDWQAHRGDVWAILGRNGAGKTTLLHTLAGLIVPPQGSVQLMGKSISDWPRRAVAKKLGLLLQDYHEPFPGSVFDYVLMGRHPHLHALQWETDEDFSRVNQALEKVGLTDFAARNIQTLSGGEFQRMRIAMLLVQDPQILLLDEPVNHLDMQFQHAILDSLVDATFMHDRAVMMSLHDVNLAARYCTHALLIHDQGRIETGPVEQVLNEQTLSELYQYPVKKYGEHGHTHFIASDA